MMHRMLTGFALRLVSISPHPDGDEGGGDETGGDFTERHSPPHGEREKRDEGKGKGKTSALKREVKNGVYILRGNVFASKPKIYLCAVCHRRFATKQKVKVCVEEVKNSKGDHRARCSPSLLHQSGF